MFQYQPHPNLLKDRTILVTGAGSGIGRTAALTYARHGAMVILLGRTTEKLEQVYDEIEANGWPQPAIIPLDLETATDHDYVKLAETIENELGQLDGLLHNAGVLGELKPVSQYPTADWQRVMHVNVTAPMMMSRELLPLMRLSGQASIIFTSSGVGHKGRAYWGAYSASKFATEGLMQVMADEEDGVTGVRVNTINPGGTRTPMRASAFPGEDPETLRTPEDIMPLYLYLMGPDSKNISGQSFHAQQ